MSIDHLSPAEITAKALSIWEKKAYASFWTTFVSALLAWMYIALGAAFSVLSISWLQNLPFGIVKVIAWLTFSLGLILVMVAWAELFTGNALLFIAYLKKKISVWAFFKNLSIVYFSNFIWALLIVFLLYIAQWHLLWSNIVGQTLFNIAVHKLHYWFFQAFSLGILCNILVCLWVWLAYSGRTTADKILGIIFPVTAFVACWFEHSVANMFYLPFMYLLHITWFTSPAMYDSSINFYSIFVGNLLPVTLGNIIWWAVFVGMLYRYLYERKSV